MRNAFYGRIELVDVDIWPSRNRSFRRIRSNGKQICLFGIVDWSNEQIFRCAGQLFPTKLKPCLGTNMNCSKNQCVSKFTPWQIGNGTNWVVSFKSNNTSSPHCDSQNKASKYKKRALRVDISPQLGIGSFSDHTLNFVKLNPQEFNWLIKKIFQFF